MAANEIHVGDIGTVFEVTLKDEGNSPEIVDISTATVKELIFRAPNGTVTTHAAAFTTDGTDGKLQYTTISASDLSISGDWRIQVHIVLGSASPHDAEWHSDIDNFACHENLS